MARTGVVLISAEQRAALFNLLTEVDFMLESLPAGWHDIHPNGFVEGKIPLYRIERLEATAAKAKRMLIELQIEAERKGG